MAMTNYERQKRWRDNNRSLFNLRRRNARKEKGGDATCPDTTQTQMKSPGSNASPNVQPAGEATITQLRSLIDNLPNEPDNPVVKPQVFRDDHGRVICETQYNALQRRKDEAHRKGYVIDDYSQ